MNENILQLIALAKTSWLPPQLPNEIVQGDMPGDKIQIDSGHMSKANVIFPKLLDELSAVLVQNPHRRAVISVCGGSGVGKSETASLLSFYLQQIGIGSYTLSGDNYPHRIPRDNDIERVRIFRRGGIRGLITSGQCTQANQETLRTLQLEDHDADPALCAMHPWLEVYQQEGRKALSGYLGTTHEIDFNEVTSIVSQFKNGAEHIFLKRMGRAATDLWYDDVDFSAASVLLIEWTHGNSDRFQGVDIPILLNSTPKETLEHRKSRQRDGGVDSPFTTMVLELEQKMLVAQAEKAKIIITKNGDILPYSEYRLLMARS